MASGEQDLKFSTAGWCWRSVPESVILWVIPPAWGFGGVTPKNLSASFVDIRIWVNTLRQADRGRCIPSFSPASTTASEKLFFFLLVIGIAKQ
jgi:hypothetical protein